MRAERRWKEHQEKAQHDRVPGAGGSAGSDKRIANARSRRWFVRSTR
jgi:hypothetical protein